ncbi:MAG TPA: GNAT family N-acetyltransferase [Soehngenia sp.]|nr:GNAT family N-acetyltransferase [Soehngenia sp.]
MKDIVRLSLEDLDCFLESLRIYFPEDDIDREIWKELFEDKRTFAYAIKENEVIKSCIAIYNWKGENDYIKIMTIGTDPEFRNKGYAHILMQHIIDESLKDDMHLFKAETRESNIKMQKVFEDFGYKIISKVEGYFENPVEIAYKYSLEV